MQAVAGIVYLLTITVVGCRLLLLARRTGALPELLLGGALILGGTLGGPLEAVAMAAKAEIGPETAGRLLFAGKAFGVVAVACHALFIRCVFRPRERWATVLVFALVACLLAGMTGTATSGAFATAETPLLWFWVDLAARLGGSTWLVLEAARYYGLMRRRLRLGLADPVVANRFFLFTVAGVCSIAFLLTSAPPVILDQERYALILTMDLVVCSAAGVGVSVLYLLTFLPPAAYLRRVRAASEAAS
jgi:hypothetical protein